MLGMKLARKVNKPQAAGSSRPITAKAMPLVTPIMALMNSEKGQAGFGIGLKQERMIKGDRGDRRVISSCHYCILC